MKTRFHAKSHSYDAHATVQRALVGFTEGVLPESLAGVRVLELGAGTGNLTQALVTRGGEVVATDNAEGMLSQGRERMPQAQWVACDAWAPHLSENFDAVATSALLQWAPDAEAVLRAWAGCVREGGQLWAGIFIKPSLPELEAICAEALPLRWRTQAEWVDAARRAGWTVQRAETMPYEAHYESALTFFRSLHGVGAVVPHRLKSMQLRAVLSRYEAQAACEGGVRASWTFLRLLAQNNS